MLIEGCKGNYTGATGPNNNTLIIPLCSKKNGKWAGKQGDSTFKPHKNAKTGKYKDLYKALKKYNKKGIRYKNGYPDFEPYAYKKSSIKAVVEVNDLEYNEGSDFRKARDAYRQKLKDAGDPNWKKWPDNNQRGQTRLILIVILKMLIE